MITVTGDSTRQLVLHTVHRDGAVLLAQRVKALVPLVTLVLFSILRAKFPRVPYCGSLGLILDHRWGDLIQVGTFTSDSLGL